MAPGAGSKFGALMLEPEVLRKQMYCIEESTCNFFGARRIVLPLAPPRCTLIQVSFITKLIFSPSAYHPQYRALNISCY